MKLITHWRCRRWLSAYLDGELTGETQRRVGQHVRVCHTCQRDVERIRSGRDLLLREEVIPALPLVGVPSRVSAFRRLRLVRWGAVTALAVLIVFASGVLDLNKLSQWWPSSSAQAMDSGFYAAQFRQTDYCVSPCTALVETELGELRSAPFPVQYPAWLPEGMALRRVIRYRTARHEGIGLIFASNGKKFSFFQQPRRLGVAATGRQTRQTIFCGRMCTWIDGGQVQLFTWRTERFCYIVATNLEKREAEAIVDSLQLISQ